MKIKICGIKYSKNAAEVASLKPDYLGFIFYGKSPRFFLDGDLKQDILDLPRSIKRVGVFVNELKKDILTMARLYGLEGVQLHGVETPELCRALKDKGLIIIKAFGVDESFSFDELSGYSNHVDYFLFDTKIDGKSGGTGQKFDWSVFNKYSYKVPFFLSGGIGPEDVEVIRDLSHKYFYGVDINSRFEESPGLKNMDVLRDFINALR